MKKLVMDFIQWRINEGKYANSKDFEPLDDKGGYGDDFELLNDKDAYEDDFEDLDESELEEEEDFEDTYEPVEEEGNPGSGAGSVASSTAKFLNELSNSKLGVEVQIVSNENSYAKSAGLQGQGLLVRGAANAAQNFKFPGMAVIHLGKAAEKVEEISDESKVSATVDAKNSAWKHISFGEFKKVIGDSDPKTYFDNLKKASALA